jgi:di/tripeptidase
MAMTITEIECSYRQAKKKSKQIKILADLNACSQEEIIQALISTGKYKRRGKFLYPTEPKKCVAEHKSTNEEENGCITLETALKVIAKEVNTSTETIKSEHAKIESLKQSIMRIFENVTESV